MSDNISDQISLKHEAEPSMGQRIDDTLARLGIADKITEDHYALMLQGAENAVAFGDTSFNSGLALIGEHVFGFKVDEYETVDDDFIPFIDFGKPDITMATVHFTPKVDRPDLKPWQLEQQDTVKSVEKRAVMAKGMQGVVTYLTLVEAGILDKPDVVVGSTNLDMARISERLGLLRLSAWLDLQTEGKTPHPTQQQVEAFTNELLGDKTEDNMPSDDTDEEQHPLEGLDCVWIVNELVERSSDPMVKTFMNGVKDSMLSGDIALGSVFGRYEDFRQKSIEFYLSRKMELIEHQPDKLKGPIGQRALDGVSGSASPEH